MSFSRLFSQKLTEASNYFADWSRTGELLFSATHRYSFTEMIPRGFIITFTALSGLLGAHLNDEENSNYSDLTIGSAAALAGFVVSHTIVILPLMHKRYLMSQECNRLVAEINAKIKSIGDYEADLLAEKYRLIDRVQKVLTVSLSDQNGAKASQTWGYRKRLLEEISSDMGNDVASVVAYLKRPTLTPTLSRN